MITKEEKMKIFVETISNLRKKTILSDKDRLKEQELIIERKSEKFRRLPLD